MPEYSTQLEIAEERIERAEEILHHQRFKNGLCFPQSAKRYYRAARHALREVPEEAVPGELEIRLERLEKQF